MCIRDSSTKAYSLSISPYFGIPFTEGFENAGAMPAYWTQEYVTGTVNWTFQAGGHTSHPASAHGGSYNALLYYGAASNHITKLVTPMINFGTNAANAQLTFWHCMQFWSPDQDNLKIYYKTSSGGTWTLLASYTSNVATWTQQTVALPNPNSSYYIAFEGNAKYGYGVCIDDVRVTSAAAPSITTTSPLPAGTAGAAYAKTLAASGGTGPVTWSLAAGSLPTGLSLSGGGNLSGTPTSAGISNFTVQVAGADGLSSTKAFSLTFNPALSISHTVSPGLPDGTVGIAYNQTVIVSGGTTPYTTLAVSGFDGGTTGLTSGSVTVNRLLGSLTVSGTPVAVGTASFTLNVTDSAGATLTNLYTITITRGYASWATGFGLTGANALPGAMPFGDGVSNLLKYAFNMDGSAADAQSLVPTTGTTGLPCLTQNGSETKVVLHLEYLRRKFSGLIYTPEQSTTLGAWMPVTATETVTDIDAEWERVAIDCPYDSTTIAASFLTVMVELP